MVNALRRPPFGVRIGLSAALLSGLALLTFIIASAAIVFDNMIEEADFVLAERSEVLLRQFKETPPTPKDLEKDEYSAPLNAELAAVKVLRFASAELDWQTDSPEWQIEWLAKKDWRRTKKRTVWNGLDVWRTYSAGSNQDHGILLAMDLYEIRREVWRMCKTFLSALPLTLLFVGFGGWWTARRSVLPLQSLATAMEHVAEGNLTESVDVSTTKDLLGRLARVFNRMTGRLQTSFEQATRFSSDASHELRTPLTILRGNLENALQKAEGERAMELAELLMQTERLRGIIDGLLLLSRSDAGKLMIGGDIVNLSALVEDVALDFESAVSDAGITLESEISPQLEVRGDQRLLRQAVGNLIGNAEKFNLPENGRIIVRVTRERDEIRVCVENSALPIAADKVDHVFRRFFRASSDRETPSAPGSGLGLSIVEAVAQAHEGRTWCEPGEKSNRFYLALPAI